jgi:poly(3-hydroxybutyrate) depolymerase
VATPGHQKIDCPGAVQMDVEVSAQCAKGGCGIIFDVHGFTMTADEEDAHTRMRLLAPPLGYVVVQPTAAGLWGTGQHNDVIWSFARATADVLKTDPDRLHFMGFSQGAILTFQMLCAHADAIASIAPDSGNGCFGGTAPAVERSILYVQGTNDNVQPWFLFGPPVRDAILNTSHFGAPTTIRSDTDYAATRWTTSHGTDFEFWQHQYRSNDAFWGGHCLPVPNGTGRFQCQNAQFDYSAEALRFFRAHPRRH